MQESWQGFIYIRSQNLNRKAPGTPSSTPAPKRKKIVIDLEKHSYPSVSGESEDEATHEENVQTLQEELQKPRPKPETVKFLMAQTFRSRRGEIVDDPKLVSENCTMYPSL